MGHFTGTDMNDLSIRAFRAFSEGRIEEARLYAGQVYEAYSRYYGPDHSLTRAALDNLRRMTGSQDHTQ